MFYIAYKLANHVYQTRELARTTHSELSNRQTNVRNTDRKQIITAGQNIDRCHIQARLAIERFITNFHITVL